jgi:hypothetical protein
MPKMNKRAGIQSPFHLAVEALARRHLGGRNRVIEIKVEKDVDGADATRVNVHIGASETYEVAQLTRMREAFANLVSEYPEVAAPSLGFFVHLQGVLIGRRKSEGPDVSSLRKRIEGLPA